MKKFITILLLVLMVSSIVSSTSTNAGPAELKVHFLDVGQGDSILLQAPNGKNMLVDGGPKSAGNKVVSFLKSKGVKKLDYIVATHPDADHIGGLSAVLNAFPVSNFIDSGKVHSSQTYFDMLSMIDAKNINFIVPKELDKLPLDPSLLIRVLSVGGEDANDNNEASIVLKVIYNKVSFLLMGDADSRVENRIRSKYDIKATFLKNGHHGSSTSSSAAFISAVKPQTAILSYGKNNSYGHPSLAVESRLNKIGAKTYKTPVQCNITVTTNGVTNTVGSSCKKSAVGSAILAKPLKKPVQKPSTVVAKPKPVPVKKVNFKNCTELRKTYPSGVAKSHAAYQSKMDRDKDGWACEK